MTAHDDRPTRTQVRTSSPDEGRELVDSMYGSGLEVGAVDDPDFRMLVDVVSAGGLAIASNDYRGELRFENEGSDQYVFGTILSGVGDHEAWGRRFGPGDVYIGIAPGLAESCRAYRCHSRAVQLPAALLDELAGADPDTPTGGWRFTSRVARPGTARRWNGVVRIAQRLLEDPRQIPGPLVVGAAVQLVAATALDVFPNTAVVEPDAADAHDAHADALRRAIAFIEADPGGHITVADVARAADVGVRALQLAFRRHLDTTPLAYLRRVRLGHAHDELVEATRDDGITVARVAFRWGFSNASRFSAAYRAEYGRTPRQTLEGGAPATGDPDGA